MIVDICREFRFTPLHGGVLFLQQRINMEKRLKINRLNSAEFFAALGILELTNQSAPVSSRFEGQGNVVEFVLTSAQNFALPGLRSLSIKALPFDDIFIAPVQ